MKNISLILLMFLVSCQVFKQSGNLPLKKTIQSIPTLLQGNFIDDYGIRYTINDTLWIQHASIKYHIISWDTAAQFLIASNDDHNPSEAGLYTRIDYIYFSNMAPFHWGFCLTNYDAATIEEAKTAIQADRQNPKKGCNGYPFSRMKKTE